MPDYLCRMMDKIAKLSEQYGEPYPARNVRDAHAVKKLKALGFVKESVYQGEPYYSLTDMGKLVMKPTYYMRGLPKDFVIDPFGRLGRNMWEI